MFTHEQAHKCNPYVDKAICKQSSKQAINKTDIIFVLL